MGQLSQNEREANMTEIEGHIINRGKKATLKSEISREIIAILGRKATNSHLVAVPIARVAIERTLFASLRRSLSGELDTQLMERAPDRTPIFTGARAPSTTEDMLNCRTPPPDFHKTRPYLT